MSPQEEHDSTNNKYDLEVTWLLVLAVSVMWMFALVRPTVPAILLSTLGTTVIVVGVCTYHIAKSRQRH